MRKIDGGSAVPALRRLSREELLQLLLEQTQETERLGALLAEQRDETERLREQLRRREQEADGIETIADAAARLSGVVDALEAAAKEHLGIVAM